MNSFIKNVLTRTALSSMLLMALFTSCQSNDRDVEASIKNNEASELVKDLSKGEAHWYFGIELEDDQFRSTQVQFEEDPNQQNGGVPDFTAGREGYRFTLETGDEVYVYGIGKGSNSGKMYYCGTASVTSVSNLADRYNDPNFLANTPTHLRRGEAIGFSLPYFPEAELVDKLFFTTKPLQDIGNNNWGYKSSGHFMSQERLLNPRENPLTAIKLPLVAETTMTSLIQAGATNRCVVNPLKFRQVACIIRTHIINAMDMRITHTHDPNDNADTGNMPLNTTFRLTLSEATTKQNTQLSSAFVNADNPRFSAVKIIASKQRVNPSAFPVDNVGYDYTPNSDDYVVPGDYKPFAMIFFPPTLSNDWKQEKALTHLGIYPKDNSLYRFGDVVANSELGYHAFIPLNKKMQGHLRGHYIELPYAVNYVDFALVPQNRNLKARFDWYKGLILSTQKNGDNFRPLLDDKIREHYIIRFNELELSGNMDNDAFRGRYGEAAIYNPFDYEWNGIAAWRGTWKNRRYRSENIEPKHPGNTTNASWLIHRKTEWDNIEKKKKGAISKLTETAGHYLFVMGNFTRINLNDHNLARFIVIAPEAESISIKNCGIGGMPGDVQEHWRRFVDALPFQDYPGKVPVIISQHDDGVAYANRKPSRALVALAYRKGYNFIHKRADGGEITCYEGGIGYN